MLKSWLEAAARSEHDLNVTDECSIVYYDRIRATRFVKKKIAIKNGTKAAEEKNPDDGSPWTLARFNHLDFSFRSRKFLRMMRKQSPSSVHGVWRVYRDPFIRDRLHTSRKFT